MNLLKTGSVASAMVLIGVVLFPLPTFGGEPNGNFWITPATTFYTDDLEGTTDFWKAAFEEAARRWNDVPTRFTVETIRESGTGFCQNFGNNSARFSSDFCGDSWGMGVLAITQQWIFSDNSVAKADIAFNSKENWSVYDGRIKPFVHDFSRVALHEIGHALGLAHSAETTALMYAYTHDGFLPQQDDVDTLESIYGNTTHTLTLSNSGSGHLIVRPLVEGTGVVDYRTDTFATSDYGDFLDCNQPSCEVTIQDGLRLTVQAVPEDGASFLSWTGASGKSDTVELAALNADLSLTAVFGDPAEIIRPEVSIIGGNRTVPDSDGEAGESVNLSATASDDDGTIVATEWLVKSMVVATGLSAEIALEDGKTGVTFRATDNDNAVAVASVIITVEEPQPLPEVHITEGSRTIYDSDNFAGELVSFSTDIPDNGSTIVDVAWLIDDLIVANGPAPDIFLYDGSTTVTVEVTDQAGFTAADHATIIIEPPPLEDGWRFPFSGVVPDELLGLDLNNIGFFDPQENVIYSCVAVLSEGMPGSFDGVERFDIAFEIVDFNQGIIGVSMVKPFNATGAVNENGELPDCSGTIELTTNIYTDLIAVGSEVYRTSFELFDGINLLLRNFELQLIEAF